MLGLDYIFTTFQVNVPALAPLTLFGHKPVPV